MNRKQTSRNFNYKPKQHWWTDPRWELLAMVAILITLLFGLYQIYDLYRSH